MAATRNHHRIILGSLGATSMLLVLGCGNPPPPEPPEPPPLSASAYTHYMRGRLAAIEGDAKEAALEFGRAAQVAPEEPEIVVAYVEALLDARRRDDAVAVALRASLKWPKRADVALSAGRALRKVRRMTEALVHLERALKLDPDSQEAALELGSALVAATKTRRAAEVYRQLIKRDSEALKPRLRLGRLLLDSGDAKAAKPVIEELLEMRPSHTSARILHSRTLAALGDQRGATQTLRVGFIASGKKLRVARRMFEQLMEAGDHGGATRFAEELDESTLSPDSRAFLGRLLLRVGAPSGALKIAERVRARDPESLEAALLAGASLARLRRFSDAAKAARSVPLTPYSRIVAAEWLALSGQSVVALRLAAELDEEDPKRHYIIARIHELTGAENRARTTFASAIKRFPGDVDLAFEAASFELRSGHSDRAIELANPLLDGSPDDMSLVNFVGYALAEAGAELARAEKLLSRALRQYPDDPNVLDSYGWLLFRQSELTEAAQTLRRAWRLAPAEPEILYHLARVEEELGRAAAAKRGYKMAFKLAIEPSLRRRIKGRLSARSSQRQ